MYTPRHMRKKYAAKGAPKELAKQRAFRRCKRISDRFIHQPPSVLEKMAHEYGEWLAVTRRGALRKG